MHPAAAILISVTLILMFGEVIIDQCHMDNRSWTVLLSEVPCSMICADIAAGNLHKIWIDSWSNAGSICSCSSSCFLPGFLSNQQGMLIDCYHCKLLVKG